MEDSPNCQQIESLLFDLRRDKLTDVRRAMVAEHLQNCRGCRELAAKTKQMFDAAGDDESSVWADIDGDLLFEQIEAELDRPQVESGKLNAPERLDELFHLAKDTDIADTEQLNSDELFDRVANQISEDDTEGQSSATASTAKWLAVAAAACAVVVAGVWMYSASAPPAPPQQPSAGVDESAPASPLETRQADRFSSLRSVSIPEQTIRIFADKDAEFEFVGTDHETIELDAGVLLVERSPGSNTPLSVRAQSYTITVTGTVFTVETNHDAPRVAVFDGSVDVTDPEGATQPLETGEYARGETRGTIDEAEYSRIEDHVDLKTHRRQRLDATRDATDAGKSRILAAFDAAASKADNTTPQPPSVDESDEVTQTESVSHRDDDPTDDDRTDEQKDRIDDSSPDSPTDLHNRALTALHDGQPQRAADLLGQALKMTDASEPARADILLELARIHLRELDNPDQAADYLDRFVEQWPDDPAADAIREQICELGVDEADCS